MTAPRIAWQPTPKQELFLSCPADEVLYGGAAGGGKSDAMLIASTGDSESGAFNNPNWRALLLRKTYNELETTLIQRSKFLFAGKGKYDQVKHRWTFPTGAILQFGMIESDNDLFKHQGAEYNWIGFDELTHFQEKEFMYLKTRLRTTDPTIKCRMRAASNPGGIGHFWVKRRFVEGAEPYELQPEIVVFPDGTQFRTTRCYIPATVYDNDHLMKNNPTYVVNLQMQPEALRRALLYGDWDIESGQFFSEWDQEAHVCEPFEIPEGWPVWISMDWGFSICCAVGFYAQDPKTGIVYMFDEIYVKQQSPYTVGQVIKSKLGKHFTNLLGRYADRRIMVKDEELQVDTKQKFADQGLYFQLATDDRVEGWRACKLLLMKDDEGQVKFKVFSNCTNFIRTIPTLIHDPIKPEDLVKRNSEDHHADQFRYFAIMRKNVIGRDTVAEPISISPVTGYRGYVNHEPLLRNRIRRLKSLRPDQNYFMDKAS